MALWKRLCAIAPVSEALDNFCHSGYSLPVHLKRRKNIKNISVRLSPQADALIVSAGLWTRITTVYGVLDALRPKILTALGKHQTVKRFIPGMVLSILGKPLTLMHCHAIKTSLVYTKETLAVKGPRDTFSTTVKLWLRNYALDVLKVKSHGFAQKLGVSINKVVIKDMKSRWGSCSSNGNLNYNWRIIFAPEPVIAYLCAHEVAHLKHMDHSKEFWHVVEGLSPDYKECRRWLRENRDSLYSYE